jgi:hypothetical protein
MVIFDELARKTSIFKFYCFEYTNWKLEALIMLKVILGSKFVALKKLTKEIT